MSVIVRVHRPVLTEEERARRMKSIEAAAVDLLVSSWKRKEKTYDDNERLRVPAADQAGERGR